MEKVMFMLVLTVVSIELQAPRRKVDREASKRAHQELGSNLAAWRGSSKFVEPKTISNIKPTTSN